MSNWWAATVIRWRWGVLVATAAFVVVGVTWGAGVFGALSSGGFADPGSDSARAHELVTAEFGNQDADLLVLYRSDSLPVDAADFQRPVTAAVAELRRQPGVTSVVSWYDTGSPAMISEDGHATFVVIRLAGAGGDEKVQAYRTVAPLLPVSGLQVQVGGQVAFLDESSQQTERDIIRAELLAAPVVLILLLFVFRGVVAATTPLLIGALAVLGGFLTTRVLTLATEMSTFAINIITLLGLGLAIDYSLFVVSRFREELTAGHPTAVAISRTLATAGRTVLVSGLTIALSLSSLLIFPQGFLRSMGLGGMSAVLVAMLATLTVLPALFAVLGNRINAGRVRLPGWRRRPGTRATAAEGAWARLARSVMRRPVWYAVAVVAVLGVLASPSLRMEFGGFDERVLPPGAETRAVSEAIAADFPGGSADPITVLVSGGSAAAISGFMEEIVALPEVAAAAAAGVQGDSTLINVEYPGEATGKAAEAAVRAIRDLPSPAGAEVLVGGRTAADLDMVDSLGQRLPWMLVLIALAIMVLLFLSFGSVVLPVKAVVMNVLSIGASLGVVVWVFQDGHLADLFGFTSTGFIEPTMPILVFAILFGLSTDYEVFLLSRVREEFDRTGDNSSSIALGLQHTGRIITAAALLLGVVIGGFATGELAFIKLVGIGMLVAIAVDVTLVRALLVPATMRLLGRWNWWLPEPLSRVYRRYGISEGAPAAPQLEQVHSLHK